MEESLKDMLKHGRKWERLKVSDEGIYIRRIPKSKDGPAYLALEINPSDTDGLALHRIGIIIRNQSELVAIREIITRKEVDEVMSVVEKVNRLSTS